MTQLYDVGPLAFQHAQAAATATFTPLLDRSARVYRICIDAVSANDVWTVTIAGREVGRYRIDTVGNQQLLGAVTSLVPKTNNIFDWFKEQMGKPLYYPVPNGQSLVVASVGGATANISIEFMEFSRDDVRSDECNGPTAREFYLPIYVSRAANVTATGESAADTEDKPAWVPSAFIGNQFAVGWQIEVWGMWLEAGGRNTFSGAADHQSVTDHLGVVRDGQRLFTRNTTADGIPMVGATAAAASANNVYNGLYDKFAAFQFMEEPESAWLDVPLIVRGGDTIQTSIGVTGDVTGGATYAHNFMVMYAHLTRVGV